MASPAELVYSNGADTTLNGALAQGATSATLADGTLFPTGLHRITVWDYATYPNPNDDPAMEIIEVTSRSGATLTLATRGVEDTTDVLHATGSRVRVTITAGGIANLYDSIQAHLHTGTTEGVKLDHGGALTGLTDDDHAAYAVIAPAATARNTVQPTAAGVVPLTVKAHASQTANLLAITTSADAALLTVDAGGDIAVGDAQDIAVGTTTGTKIGTAAAQKIGLWGVTPVVQPADAAQAEVTLGNSNGEIAGLTFSATPTQAECEALRDKCEELADDVRALSALLHAIRTANVNTGLIKGSA